MSVYQATTYTQMPHFATRLSTVTFFATCLRALGKLGSIGFFLLARVTEVVDWDCSVAGNVVPGDISERKGTA